MIYNVKDKKNISVNNKKKKVTTAKQQYKSNKENISQKSI